MKKVKVKWDKVLCYIMIGLVVIYSFFSMYLYYMQSIQPLNPENHNFESDLPYHIHMILEDGWYYSFTAYAYQVLYLVFGKTTIGIAIFLAVVTFFTVYFTERILRKFLNLEKNTWYTWFLGLLGNLAMPFFWEYAGLYRYVSYQSGNIWHNSTYQCMKLVALIAFLYYWKINEHFRERGLYPKEWIIFSGLLALCTGIKPSFLTVFAPTMALFLLGDLCKKVSFKKIFFFGSTVFPSLAVILWQQSVLFGENTGNGIGIKLWYSFSLHADRPKVAVICSLAFPIVVLFFSFMDLIMDRKYLFIWLMTGVGFLQAVVFVEEGERAKAGNFLWGYCFSIFILFVYSMIELFRMIKKSKKYIWYRIFAGVSLMVMCYQIYCGVVFFVRLVQGETYWMLK